MPPVGFRYVSTGETKVVQSASPWRVPNLDRAGKPKEVYFTWELYTSVSQAEIALKIQPPSDRLDLDLTGVAYTFVGTVLGGTGTELTTPDSPLVTAITPLIVP